MRIYLVIAYRNLQRHWRASLAAILSVAAGFIALVLFEGYIEDSRIIMLVEFRERLMFGDIVVERENYWSVDGRSDPWKYRISPQDHQFLDEYLKASPDVSVWMRNLRLSGIASNGKVSMVFWGHGFDLEKGFEMRGKGWSWNTLYGKPLEMSSSPGVLLGQNFARSLGCLPTHKQHVPISREGYPPGERPFVCEVPVLQLTTSTPTGQISAVDLDIQGFVDAGMRDVDARFLYLPLEQAQSLVHTDGYSYLTIRLKEGVNPQRFANELNAAATSKGVRIQASDWRLHRVVGDFYRRSTELLNVFRNFVILVILCISTLSVLNTLIKIVKERTREVGTWRSLGYNPDQIRMIFVAEALGLGLVGCFIGVILALVVSLSINKLDINYQAGMFSEPVPFNISIVPVDYLLSILILMFVCLVASVLATRGILKKKVSENLIYA